MIKKAIYLFALVAILTACKNSDNINIYETWYEQDGIEYEYHLEYPDGINYATAERYAAFDIADDKLSIVALMDSLIDADIHIGAWCSLYYSAMKETLPPDSILQRLQRQQNHKPSNTYVYWAIGNTYTNLDEPQKAIEYFHKGLDIASDCSYLWHSLGMVTLQQGDTVSAINCLTKALELAQEHNIESRAELIQQMLDSIESKDQLRVTEPISETANTTPRRRWKKFFSGLRT
ncbi:tetratricopeptide repeat protein [Bacteroides acidifaciens]|uniref:tetratricopeptide repeat protein n=1 Tax=Bacteroides acidifaciens TaxID=85831 RepID=UPI0025A9F15E|nr:tetratricopeptide repeat protein [Bacteroides acidifaciens]